MKLIVTFESSTQQDFDDVMIIVSDNNYKKNIYLYAYAPCGQIIFEPFLNLGFVKVNQEKKETIKFLNEGVR